VPFFDFKCEKCGHQFTLRVSNEEKSKVKCEKCGHSRVIQLLSPFFAPGSKADSGRRVMPGPNCEGCSSAGMG